MGANAQFGGWLYRAWIAGVTMMLIAGFMISEN